ncbi:NYN domain-containing protein, partial [Patescibacteria group bacterium]|nr:NYN domain-containing protein [Patescibacteria group bacterium]
YSVYVSGKYAYVASVNNNNLAIFDISNPDSIIAKGYTSTNLSGPRSVYVSGKYAYVTSYGNSRLAIFELNNAELPNAHIGSLSVDNLQVQDNVLMDNGLYVRGGLNIGQGFYSQAEGSIFASTTQTAALTVSQSGTGYGLLVNGGNVGIGTTTPAYALTVVGQCVTGDTRLRRRRRKRSQNAKRKTQNYNAKLKTEEDDEYIYDEVMIKDVQPGDEIASLDEKTGQIVWSKVNGLMDMGVKPIYKLTTATGKIIRTTGNHPYLVKNLEPKVLEPFEPKIGVFIDNANLFYAQKQSGWKMDVKKFKELFKNLNLQFINYHIATPDKSDHSYKDSINYNESIQPYVDLKIKLLKYIPVAGKIVKKGDVDVNLTIDAIERLKDFDIAMIVSGDSDYLALRDYLLKKEKKVVFMSFKRNLAYELKQGKYITIESIREFIEKNGDKKTPEFDLGRILLNLLYSDEKTLSSGAVDAAVDKKDGQWKKVAYLSEGMEIAVQSSNGKNAVWDEIVKIENLPAEQVYDIEVEGTHNFIGNDIIAHNTYISATTTLASDLVVDTNTLFVDSANNRVGIGTTAPNNLLQVQGLINFNNALEGTLLGYEAGKVNTGSANTLVGYQAGTGITSGYSNTALGAYSLGAVIGGLQNTGIGYGAGYSISSGNNNILLGYQAGKDLTTGSNNIVIGHDINAGTAAGSNQLNIGNTIYGDLSTGNIGIGATSTSKLTVSASSSAANLLVNQTGTGKIVDFQDNGTSVFTILDGGNVGIGTSTPSYTLDVSGTLRVTPAFATGGAVTYFGGYKIHTFVTGGTFTVTGSGDVEVLVVAGGGGGGDVNHSGGGGAGGMVEHASKAVTAGSITVIVGAGGAGAAGNYNTVGSNGNNSSFGDIVANGGGGGRSYSFLPPNNANNGGSGGGAACQGGLGGTATQGNSGGGTGYGNNGANKDNTPTGGGG